MHFLYKLSVEYKYCNSAREKCHGYEKRDTAFLLLTGRAQQQAVGESSPAASTT